MFIALKKKNTNVLTGKERSARTGSSDGGARLTDQLDLLLLLLELKWKRDSRVIKNTDDSS